MKYTVTAIQHDNRWWARITMPGEIGVSLETEFLHANIHSRNPTKCLLKGAKFALDQDDCDEVQVITP